MASPQDTTIENLTGNWILQKVLWLLRKALALGTIYISISQYKTPDLSPDQTLTHINFTQTTTGGLAGTAENRVLDWKTASHEDYIFGHVQAQAEYVYGTTDADGKIRPDVEVKIDNANEEIRGWLRGEKEVDGSFSEGFLVERQSEDVERGDGLWVHTFECNEGVGWMAEQVWGFEVLAGMRYFSRRVVVMDGGGRYICGRIVFDFLGRESG
ncbi:uncharacterized protein N7515_005540 [Penicillium bovifimosum]|uniref:Lipocalin-like domain-containing protein n=1 Tax=Penicillium bovifimosum TaxID=126998 RepID=A0A9W9KZX6_9EURO|nr:uncharacterized protein N7515_005540 [Penicillium bovifimosum]KAJ5129501.1 hypothetical protein N7515_005540 [Penicillium bovifimosum]